MTYLKIYFKAEATIISLSRKRTLSRLDKDKTRFISKAIALLSWERQLQQLPR